MSVTMHELDTEDELEEARRRSFDAPVVFYKHSTTCGVSIFARRELNGFRHGSAVPVYMVVVQRSRAISKAIEKVYGVRHESPQVVVVHRDEPIYHASHGRIRMSSIQEAIDEAVGRPST